MHLSLAGWLLLAVAPTGDDVPPVEPSLAFVNVSVVTMEDDRVRAGQTVLVADGEIQGIGATDAVSLPEGTRRVDGTGRYLMPGLVDTHVHFPDEDFEHHQRRLCRLFLIHGVTTVINLKGSPQHVELRARLNSGEALGPHLYTSGPFVNEPQVSTPEQARAAVEEHEDRGYDLVKIHGDLSPETYRALAEASREAELCLAGHAPRNLPFRAVLEEGQVWVVHAEELIYTHFEELDPEDVPELVPEIVDAGLWLTPTLSTFHAITRQWGAPEVVTEARAQHPLSRSMGFRGWDAWIHRNPYTGRDTSDWPQEAYEFQQVLVRQLHEAGVPLMAGTDTPLPLLFPGWSLQEEMEELLACGLTSCEALATATANPGRFVEEHVAPDHFFGTVAAGQRADLLLVAGNPLEDVHVTAAPLGVMVGGRWLPAERLAAIRAELESTDQEERESE